MIFFSRSNPRFIVPCPEGDRMRDDKALVIDIKGNKSLKKVGETDQYAVIQSYKEGCDIKNLIETYAVTKDTRVFQRKTGSVFGDATVLPKTLVEAHDIFREAESAYNNLSAVDRAQYGDYKSFLSSFGSFDGISSYLTKIRPVKEDLKGINENVE